MKLPPCKECTERQAKCHSTCKKYIEWKAEHETKRETISQKRSEDILYHDYKVNQIVRTKKRRNK